MAKDGNLFEQWLDEGGIPQRFREPQSRAVLQAAYDFLQQSENDYATRRILAHFLLHCGLGLKLAQIARLVGVTRPTASRQNKLSSRQVVREIQHRLSGRPYGKLLPRYAGPIAQFLVTQPQASRDDLLDFIEATWNMRVSLTAMHNFLHTYGLDRQSLRETTCAQAPHPAEDEPALIAVLDQPPHSGLPLPLPAEDFFLDTRSTLVPSC